MLRHEVRREGGGGGQGGAQTRGEDGGGGGGGGGIPVGDTCSSEVGKWGRRLWQEVWRCFVNLQLF